MENVFPFTYTYYYIYVFMAFQSKHIQKRYKFRITLILLKKVNSRLIGPKIKL